MLSPKISFSAFILCSWLFLGFFAKAQTHTGTVSGTISSADNKPLPGATISIMNIAKTQSDKNGVFIISGIPAGTITLRVTNIGKIGISTQLNIIADKVINVSYTMDDDVTALKTVVIGSKSIYLKFNDIANLPEGLAHSAFATDERYIYSVNGFLNRGGFTKAVLKYDPANNTWLKLTEKLRPKMDVSAAYVSSTNKIYVIGGITNFNEINYSIESVDVSTGEVAKIKVDNPMPSMYGGSAVWDNKIYFFGGSKFRLERKLLEGIVSVGESFQSLYVFNPEKSTFTELADMPYAAEISGAIVNGVLYTFGGYDPFQHKAFNYISAYDIATNKWRSLGQLPVNVSATDLAVYGDKIFIVGSHDDDTYLGYYNTNDNTFTKVKSNLKPRKHGAAGIIQGRYLVTFGGVSHLGTKYVSAQMIDLDSVFKDIQ